MTITIKFSDNIEHNYNSFEEILKIDNYDDIIDINCSWINLSVLPNLPNSLIRLCCHNNNLSSLPELPNSLTYIDCANNNLSSLSKLPNSLKKLWCGNNNLSVLPELPNSLTELWCYNNNLSSLPKLPNSLNYFSYNTNPIFIYIKKYFEGDREKYFEYEINMKKKFTNKIEIWFLDCKYNPKYKYCRKRLMKEYNELYN